MKKLPRAIVLGASGFIGSRLVEYLASRGWHVDRGVRSASTGDDHRGSGRIFAIGSDGSELSSALAASSPEIIFNLAASGVGREVSSTVLIDGNAGMVARLLDSIDVSVTRRVIHAGSWSQYVIRDPDIDIDETTPMEPPTPYGAAKVGAELLGRARSMQMGLDFLTLRLFNVYGPGEGPNRLIPHVVRTLSTGRSVSLTSGEQVRDFVYIDDVASAFEHAALLRGAGSRSFNIATGVGTTVRDVAILAAHGLDVATRQLRFGELEQRKGEPIRVVGDSSMFRAATGWKPRVSISDGIVDTACWVVGANRTDH